MVRYILVIWYNLNMYIMSGFCAGVALIVSYFLWGKMLVNCVIMFLFSSFSQYKCIKSYESKFKSRSYLSVVVKSCAKVIRSLEVEMNIKFVVLNISENAIVIKNWWTDTYASDICSENLEYGISDSLGAGIFQIFCARDYCVVVATAMCVSVTKP